jgi:hypothetical protein
MQDRAPGRAEGRSLLSKDWIYEASFGVGVGGKGLAQHLMWFIGKAAVLCPFAASYQSANKTAKAVQWYRVWPPHLAEARC